jgi:hypothetical protein
MKSEVDSSQERCESVQDQLLSVSTENKTLIEENFLLKRRVSELEQERTLMAGQIIKSNHIVAELTERLHSHEAKIKSQQITYDALKKKLDEQHTAAMKRKPTSPSHKEQTGTSYITFAPSSTHGSDDRTPCPHCTEIASAHETTLMDQTKTMCDLKNENKQLEQTLHAYQSNYMVVLRQVQPCQFIINPYINQHLNEVTDYIFVKYNEEKKSHASTKTSNSDLQRSIAGLQDKLFIAENQV